LYDVVFGFIYCRVISNEAKHALITVNNWLPSIAVGVRVNCACFQTKLDFFRPGELRTDRNVIVIFPNLVRIPFKYFLGLLAVRLGQKLAVERTIQIDKYLWLDGCLFNLSKGLRMSLKTGCHQLISRGHFWLAKNLLMDLLFADISYIK